jgi:hypothetical protein
VKPAEVASNHLRWEIKDMPALDLENIHATPAWGALAARMSVKWGDAAVNGADNQWRAIGLWQEQLEEHRPDPTPEIAAKALELTAGAPDLYTKLSRITDYIQKNIRYFIVERGIGGWQAHYAADIYRNRYGDCKDKTTLLISMLQAIGIKRLLPPRRQPPRHHRSRAPSLAGNHMITAIELPEGESDPRLSARVKAATGKTLLIFDPTDEETPVGLIRAALQGAYGNISSGPDSQVLRMPVLPPESAGLTRKGSFTLTADGILAGDVAEIFYRRRRHHRALVHQRQRQQGDPRQARTEPRLRSPRPHLQGLRVPPESPTSTSRLASISTSAPPATPTPPAPLLLLRPRVLGSHAHVVTDVMEGKPRLLHRTGPPRPLARQLRYRPPRRLRRR